jgi:hypothetical protein
MIGVVPAVRVEPTSSSVDMKRGARSGIALLGMLGLLIAFVGVLGELRSPVNGDVAWLLYVGTRVLDGARTYVDILEVNPPLVVWLSAGSVALSRALDVDPVAGYRGLVWLLACVSLGVTALVLPGRSSLGGVSRAGLLLALLTALFAMPAGYFGEREHVALALMAPLLCRSGMRGGVELSPRAMVAIGMLAGLGIAIKPHFVMVWLPLAVLDWRRHHTEALPLHAPVGLLQLGYGVAVLALAPEYVPMVQRIGADYQRFSAHAWGALLTRDTLPISVLLALVVYLLTRATLRDTALADRLAIATAGALLAVLTQGKGFGYHWLLPIGTSVLLLAFLTADAGHDAGLGRVGRRVLSWAGLLVCLWPFLGATERRARGELSPIDRWTMETAGYLRAAAPGAVVGVLSARLADAFPLTLYAGTEWPFRFPHLWFISVYRSREERPAESWARHVVGEDLRDRKPALLLVRDYRPDAPLDLRDDVVEFLSRDSLFAREFAGYRRVERVGELTVYRRESSR